LPVKQAKQQADQLYPSNEKARLLREAREADTAAHIEDWVNSAGLQPPKTE
jgi:hypothetical protein